MNERSRSIVALVVSVGACFLVGLSGSLVTTPSVRDWYPQIDKPSWTPPDAVFGPVWGVLYLLMGIAAWMIWRNSVGGTRRRAILIFAIQLLLNSLWSLLFFGLRNPGAGLFEIVVLWCAIVATIVTFARIDRIASLLLVPYLLWVSFATALNFAIWNLNRS